MPGGTLPQSAVASDQFLAGHPGRQRPHNATDRQTSQVMRLKFPQSERPNRHRQRQACTDGTRVRANDPHAPAVSHLAVPGRRRADRDAGHQRGQMCAGSLSRHCPGDQRQGHPRKIRQGSGNRGRGGRQNGSGLYRRLQLPPEDYEAPEGRPRKEEMKGSRAIIRRKLSWHTVYREIKGNEENRLNEID